MKKTLEFDLEKHIYIVCFGTLKSLPNEVILTMFISNPTKQDITLFIENLTTYHKKPLLSIIDFSTVNDKMHWTVEVIDKEPKLVFDIAINETFETQINNYLTTL